MTARFERLEKLFGLELADRTERLGALIASVEQTGDRTALLALGRELHSLKGAARAADVAIVEQVAHAAEGAVLAADGDVGACLHAVLEALEQLRAFQAPAQRTLEPRGETDAEAPRAKPTADFENTATREQGSVRVSLAKLDTLLTESGELAVTQLRITQRLEELRGLQRQIEHWQRDWTRTRSARARLRRAHAHTPGRDADGLLRAADNADQAVVSILQRTRELVSDLTQNTAHLATVANAIGQEVMAIRLLPAGTVFSPFERLVRDLSRQMGKEARLELSGSETEIDRRILDELRDPLMHMVRNTIDHGIESPADRTQAGKPAQGTLKLSAVQRGDRVQIVVEDDGRGLDVEAIRATAARRGLLSAERADALDTPALVDLIFHPGFSTRETVTDVSGRGVGLDVVREQVSKLSGDINVRTVRGSGTVFTITVPLTLATTRVLLVEDGGQTYAVPSSNIERTGRVRASDLHRLEGRLAVHIDGRAVPVVELSTVLGTSRNGTTHASEAWRPFFVLPQGNRAVAVLTEQLIDETELVVKPLGAPLKRVRHVGGAAVLGTGHVVVILNPSDVFRSAVGNLDAAPRLAAAEAVVAQPERPMHRVLVVDDSVMTRTLERTILEAAGYAVVVATDGAHALEILDQTAVDAIVSDVEMPRMNGFDLTAAVRQDERWRHLPVVLVTSLDAPDHVERGASAGADAYIVKGRFDQNDLLQTVGRLL
jgi:two-component system, chemotaxis family, sensor kinase CheA